MNQKWFYRLYRLACLQRCYTKQPKNSDFQNVMTCSQSDISVVTSSNIMLHITTQTDNGCFAPIYQHQDMASYVKKITTDYYSFVSPYSQFAHSDKMLILEALENPDHLHTFSHMGSIWSPNSLLSKFIRTGDPKLLGLDTFPTDEDSAQRLRHFVRKYASGALLSYRQNSLTKNGQWHTAAANRSMAVEALADMLGLSYMFPHGEYRTLVIDGVHKCFGLYTNCASGQDTTQIPGDRRQEVLTPLLQRELNRLNMLDVLTCEVDHCPENYFLIVNENGATGISVFDNSSEQNFPIQRNVSFQTIIKCAPYVDEQGFLNRPYVDAQITHNLSQISLQALFRGLRPYLGALPTVFLYFRLKRVLHAIQRSVDNGSTRALEYEDWNQDTLNRELQCKQKTYLHSYLSDCIHV